MEQLTPTEMEAALQRLRKLSPDSPRAIALRQEILLSVRGVVVRAAETISKRYPGVQLEDLVNEGLLGVMPVLARFEPGRAKGKCLLPGVVAMVSKQRMIALGMSLTTPARITSSARKKASRIARQAKKEEADVARALAEAGLAGVYLPGAELDVALPSTSPLAEEEILDAETMGMLGDAVSALSFDEREIVERTYGLGGHEAQGDRAIASELGMTLEEMRTARGQALDAIRDTLLED